LDHSNNSNFSSNISNNSISLDNISKYENKLENSFRSIRTYIKEKLDLENEYHLEIKKKNDRFKTSQKNIYDLSKLVMCFFWLNFIKKQKIVSNNFNL
jgi:hypothetical protein